MTYLDLLPKAHPIQGFVRRYSFGELDNEMDVEPEGDLRECVSCHDTKSLSEFALTKFQGKRCKVCVNKQARERYARQKENRQ